MKLSPIATIPEPDYPTYRPELPSWKKVAAAVATSAALLLPACGDDSCPTRLGGDIQPTTQEVRLAGETPAQQPGKPKPPEPVAQPDPPPRTAGIRPAPAPPERPPEIRFGGEAPAPEHPRQIPQ